jgi:plastocyanin
VIPVLQVLAMLLLTVLSTGTFANASISGVVRIEDGDGKPGQNHTDAVVFIEGVDDAGRARLRSKQASTPAPHLSHRNRAFTPHVLPVVVGTSVDFRNDDSIFHNAFSLSKAKPFDLGVYAENTSRKVLFDQSGLVRVYCNLHPDMVSNILVLDNHHFAIADASGAYRLDAVPPGDYLLRVWSEQADARSLPVTLQRSTPFSADFALKARRQFLPHRNKYGKPYRNKY